MGTRALAITSMAVTADSALKACVYIYIGGVHGGDTHHPLSVSCR